jgi:hypothetical protein
MADAEDVAHGGKLFAQKFAGGHVSLKHYPYWTSHHWHNCRHFADLIIEHQTHIISFQTKPNTYITYHHHLFPQMHTMVEIYLNAHGTQVHFLSIPDSNVQRLSKCPFKWLHYVLFTICGACGDISTIPDGTAVDYYGSTSLANAIYHYNPTGTFFLSMLNMLTISHFCRGFHLCGLPYKQMTSTASVVTHRPNFRQDIKRRDGDFCTITREPAVHCDTVHLIPKCKGDEVSL